MASGAGDVASSVSGRVAATPELARRQAQGNPLAAGLIAFGVGWLASSMLPVTETEKQVGARLKDQASSLAEPVKERLSEAAQEVAGNLQPTVQDAVSSVKGAAADATSEVQEQARQSAQQVRGTAESAASHVQGATQSAAEQVKGTSTRSAPEVDDGAGAESGVGSGPDPDVVILTEGNAPPVLGLTEDGADDVAPGTVYRPAGSPVVPPSPGYRSPGIRGRTLQARGRSPGPVRVFTIPTVLTSPKSSRAE